MLTGEAGQRALQRIEEAATPASRSLLAIDAVSQEVSNSFRGVAGNAGSMGSILARLGPIGIAAAVALGGLALAASKGIQEFKDAEEALKSLNAALSATGSVSGVTAREITALGEMVELTTLFRKEDIQNAAAALTSFQSVSADVFMRTLALSANLAVRMGSDLPAAAETLGRALENPENGLGRLARKFSDLSPTQKEAIEQFIRQGDVVSAQIVILEDLENKTRDLAEAQAKGLTGASNELRDAWEGLMESFGTTLVNTGVAQGGLSLLTKAVWGLNEALFPTDEQRRNRLADEIAALEDSFGTRLDRWVLGSAPALDEKNRQLKALNDALAEEQRKADEEKQAALDAADRAAATRRNETLLQIEKDYQKKLREATQTEREKVVQEAEEAKQKIDALFRDDRNSEAARRATEAVDENLRARLVKLDEEAAKPARALAEANEKIVESLRKRVELEAIADPRQRFVQAELDKLNASATEEYREAVRRLAESLYEKEQASETARKAEEAHRKAIREINREALHLIPTYDLAKQALDEWKESMLTALGEVTEENRKYLELLEQIYQVKLRDIYQRSLEDSRKWEDGAVRSLERYADEATNAAKNAEEVFGGAARKIEDALTDALSSGEISLKKLGDLILAIEQDIMRAFVRQNITGPIAGALGDIVKGSGGDIFGSIFSSIFHGGGTVGASGVSQRAVPAHTFIGAPRLHNGLMPDEFPAILQRGETVLPKDAKVGDVNVVFNISTPNAQSFMDSRGQIMAKFAGEMQRFRMRNA